jgi:hypothetical protein
MQFRVVLVERMPSRDEPCALCFLQIDGASPLCVACSLSSVQRMPPPVIDAAAAARARAFIIGFDAAALLAATGVSADTFVEFYGKYAVACGSPLNFCRTLVYLKMYPTVRAFGWSVKGVGASNGAWYFAGAKRTIRALSRVVRELSVDDLDAPSNHLPGGFFPDARGLIDCVPFYVEGLKSAVRKLLFSGKYHDTVWKFEVITNLRGFPIAFSGPFDVSQLPCFLTECGL